MIGCCARKRQTAVVVGDKQRCRRNAAEQQLGQRAIEFGVCDFLRKRQQSAPNELEEQHRKIQQNTELVEAIGEAGAKEAKENNLAIWLTPALNIHRSPLCGRNFEYYSEDPFISGKMAAAMVRGIQSQRIVATPKHFACNNKEIKRKFSDSIVSERAIREIYLKGFEICVKESDPKLIMTSYNLINGVYTSESAELLEGILRREWGFSGLVTTDWSNGASKYAEIIAGNDIRMPDIWTGVTIDNPRDHYIEYDFDDLSQKSGRDRLALSVRRLLEMLLWLE